jgi:hypothetical protein
MIVVNLSGQEQMVNVIPGGKNANIVLTPIFGDAALKMEAGTLSGKLAPYGIVVFEVK